MWGGTWEIGRKIENFDFAVNGQGMGGESVGNRFGMSFVTRGPIFGPSRGEFGRCGSVSGGAPPPGG